MMIDIRSTLSKPGTDEFEITTIGCGPSQGESIVIHLGNDDWVIIDSCQLKNESLPLPLQYLQEISVSFDKVVIVVCTHWHADHTKGLPVVLQYCTNAKFLIAPLGEFKDFTQYVLKLNAIEPLHSGAWSDFEGCLNSLFEYGKRRPKFVSHDQLLYQSSDSSVKLHSLSPSDAMITNFYSVLLSLDKNNPTKKGIQDLDANMCSLALVVDFKGLKVFIGGDVETNRRGVNRSMIYDCSRECGDNLDCGFCNIKNEGLIYQNHLPFDFIQISHHGSVTGYCPLMWQHDADVNSTIATTTVFTGRGEPLPRRDMLEIYKKSVSKLYITGITLNKQSSNSPFPLRDLEGIKDIPDFKDEIGIVVCRWNNKKQQWTKKIFGAAKKVTKKLLKNYHRYYVKD